MLDLVSLVRLGISLGYFDIDYSTAGELMFAMLNATIVDEAGADLSEDMCSKLRASLVREILE